LNRELKSRWSLHPLSSAVKKPEYGLAGNVCQGRERKSLLRDPWQKERDSVIHMNEIERMIAEKFSPKKELTRLWAGQRNLSARNAAQSGVSLLFGFLLGGLLGSLLRGLLGRFLLGSWHCRAPLA
jgi:hypothetical protein